MPQDIGHMEFQEMLAEIKTQSDAVQTELSIMESDMASIVTSMLSASGMADLDEVETVMFYELLKHLLERMSCGSD